MKHIGFRKEIDHVGRIVIPKEIRDLFNLKDEVEILVTTEGVLLRNPKYILVEAEEYGKITDK